MRKSVVHPICGRHIILLCLCMFLSSVCSKDFTSEKKSPYGPPLAASPLVVSFHEGAAEAGYKILESGGNAFDAFVAVTLAENVAMPGPVTLAGLLTALIYHAKTDSVISLDGGFNSVMDPDGAYDQSNPVLGKKVMVPGLVSGLEALLTRYGRLSLAEVLQPAIEMAREGIPVSEYYAGMLEITAPFLRQSEYGHRTFFLNGSPLHKGDILKQPEVAEFLTKLAEKGASYMYTGEWAEECVETVKSEGGLMTFEDLASYEPNWVEPWKMSYRDYDICGSSGRVMFGLWTLLALKTLEHTSIQPLGHFSESADALEIVVRTARAVSEEAWIFDYQSIDDRDLVNSRLTSSYTDAIWAKVEEARENETAMPPTDSDTLCSVVVDKEGNVIAGKHSVNSELWGTGLFVQGIPLSSTGELTARMTKPGKRRLQGASNFLVFKDGKMRSACGVIGGSNPQTAFQFLVNVMDYGFPADQAAEFPRFGNPPYDAENQKVDASRNLLDQRINQEIVDILKDRGLFFTQKSPRVGIGCVATFHPNGKTTSGWSR